ncbi:MAG: SoxR reducing system RseC family protein [Methylotenera sp.]
MIEERAVILSLERDANNISSGDSIATLEIERKTACGLCGQTRGCGNSIWGKLFAHQSTAFKAQNRINAKVGDSVIVGINEKALLKSALLLYILPLATMLFGAILATQFSASDSSALIGAVVGLVLGLLWVKGHTMSSSYFTLQQPVILRLAFQETVVKFS